MWWLIILIVYVIIKFIMEVIKDYYMIKTKHIEELDKIDNERHLKHMAEHKQRNKLIKSANKPGSEYMESYLPKLETLLNVNDIKLPQDE